MVKYLVGGHRPERESLQKKCEMDLALLSNLWIQDVLNATDITILARRTEAALAESGSIGFTVAAYSRDGEFNSSVDAGMNGWLDRYKSEGMARVCPFASRISKSLAPFSLDQVRRTTSKGSPGADVISKAASYDIKHGYYVPQASGVDRRDFVFFRTENEVTDPEFLNVWALIANAAHCSLRQMKQSQKYVELPVISARELEVLRWLARGKSSIDVGDILGISESTVRYHYKQAAGQLGTLNRAHTVFEALKRGLLSLD